MTEEKNTSPESEKKEKKTMPRKVIIRIVVYSILIWVLIIPFITHNCISVKEANEGAALQVDNVVIRTVSEEGIR